MVRRISELTIRQSEPARWRGGTAVAVMVVFGLLLGHGRLFAQSLELRFAPRAKVFALKDRRPGAEYYGLHRYYNFMLQNVAVVNHGPDTVSVDEGSIDRGSTSWPHRSVPGHQWSGNRTLPRRHCKFRAARVTGADRDELRQDVAAGRKHRA